MTDIVMAVLRAVHITGTVFWAGGTFLVAGYHEYVLDPGDPERTLERMAAYNEMSKMVGMAGIIGVLAGLVMYWFVSGGLALVWITSPYGAAITVGGIAGLLAIAIAVPFIGFTNERSVELHETMQDAGQLTDEQAAEVSRLRARLETGERAAAVFMLLAILAMSTAQYL